MSNHLFLSYRSLERQAALKIAADLKNAGIRIWMDSLDCGIEVGDDWVATLQEKLDTSRGLIALISPDYVQSRYCRDEMRRSRQLGKPIFPVVISPLAAPEDWPFEIQSVQCLDLSAWRSEDDYRSGVETLTRALRERFELPTPLLPDVETQFLTSLLAELEASRGVLEYVDLKADVDAIARKPQAFDEWGFDVMIEPPDGRRAPTEVKNPADLVRVWADVGKLALLGGPGAGKTTTIRRLALTMARERLARGRLAPLPLVVNLPRWPRKQSLIEFLGSYWPFQADLGEALKEGEAVLFLDGLNEMGLEGEGRSKQLREWLARPEAPSRVLVTCREADYPALDVRIHKGHLQALDANGVEVLARAYLDVEADVFLGRIKKSASAYGNWWGGGRDSFLNTPYFLSALLFLYQYGDKEAFPSSSGELILQLLKAMWAREERRGTILNYSFERCIRDLSGVAYAIIRSGSPLTLSRKSFEDLLVSSAATSGRTALDAGINLGVLREDRHGHAVRFEHQLFVEFFASYRLAEMEITDEILEATRSPLWTVSDAQPRWLNRRRDWTEVLVAASGLSLLDDDAIRTIANKNAFLAARCARAKGEVRHELSGHIQKELRNQTAEAQERMDRPSIPGSITLGFERHTDEMLEREIVELERMVKS